MVHWRRDDNKYDSDLSPHDQPFTIHWGLGLGVAFRLRLSFSYIQIKFGLPVR